MGKVNMFLLIIFALWFEIEATLSILKPSRIIPNNSRTREPLAMLGLLEGYFKPKNYFRKSHDALSISWSYDQRCLLEIIREVFNQATENGLLADYSLELYYQEGEILQNFTWQLLPEFVDQVTQSAEKKIMAPIFLTPSGGCGHRAFEDFIAPIKNMMRDLFSTPFIHSWVCYTSLELGYSVFHSKQAHPIMFDDNLVETNGQAAFVELMPHWKEVSVVAIPDILGIKRVNRLQELFIKTGIKIIDIHFGDIDNYTAIFTIIKKSRARIIILAMDFLTQEARNRDCDMCAALYCQSYRAGVRGSSYVLLFQGKECTMCTQLNLLSSNLCSVEEMKQQAYITFTFAHEYIAPQLVSLINSQFLLQSIGNFLNFNDLTRQMKTIGCHKTAYISQDTLNPAKYEVAYTFATMLLLLDSTDKILKQQFSSSISMERNRTLLSELLTQAATKYELTGSNAGVTFANDKRWEMTQVVRPQELIYVGSVVESRSIEISNKTPIVWTTKNGQPPRDMTLVLHYIGEKLNKTAAWTMTAAAIFVVIIQLANAVRHKARKFLEIETGKILFCGCLLLLAASVTSTLGQIYFLQAAFYLRHVLALIGVSLINAIIVGKTVLFSLFISGVCYTPSRLNNPYFEFKRTQNVNIRKIVTIVFLVAVCFVICSASDPGKLVYVISEPEPDPITNIYFDVTVQVFKSQYENYWIAPFVIVNCLFLWLGCCICALLRTQFKKINSREMRGIQKSVIYSALVFYSAVLTTTLSFVTNSSDVSDFVLAGWLMLYSMLNSYFIFLSPNKQVFRTSYRILPM